MTKLNFPIIRKFTVTSTPKRLLDANPKRKAVLIYNNGSVTVELLSAGGKFGDGIPISPNSPYDNDHFNCQGEYWVATESSDCEIRVEEDIQGDIQGEEKCRD